MVFAKPRSRAAEKPMYLQFACAGASCQDHEGAPVGWTWGASFIGSFLPGHRRMHFAEALMIFEALRPCENHPMTCTFLAELTYVRVTMAGCYKELYYLSRIGKECGVI